jgi:hypothetical protein
VTAPREQDDRDERIGGDRRQRQVDEDDRDERRDRELAAI